MLMRALLVVLSVAMFATDLSAQSSDSQRRAEEEVRKLNVDEVDAFLHKDPTAMERIWSDDMVVTNPLNKFVNKQQVLGMMRSGFLVITSYDRQIEYVRVYSGDTVIVAGGETVAWGGRMPNAGRTEHLRFTAVWMKQDGRWQEVARHANIVPEPKPGP